jgi:ATP phosphoribosyltransferase regulatory subunit
LAASDPFEGAGPEIGLRTRAEVAARIEILRADAAAAPLSGEEVALLDALLAVRETIPHALEQLHDLTVDLPAITTAVSRIEARAEAMEARGIAVDTLEFEASYGRTQMEYYDGFVFGFHAEGRPDLPPVATGGRYDALTRRLGAAAGHPEREIPAVGGVIRPALMLTLAEAGA